MSQSDRPRRNCRNPPVTSQPAASSLSLQRQARARDRVRAGGRTKSSSQACPVQPTLVTTSSASQPARVNEGGAVSTNRNVITPADENLVCPLCALQVQDSGPGLFCDKCCTWFHPQCLFITDNEYTGLQESDDSWFCDHCKSIQANRISWGVFVGEEAITNEFKSAYNEIVTWRKNLFLLPRGKVASDFIKELTRLMNLFANKTQWERLSFLLIHTFMPIMLQKPSKTSKAKDHSRYLLTRLERWKAGDLHGLMAECREIQKRLVNQKKQKQDSKRKTFCKLMLLGKVKQALSFINNDNDVRGVHSPTEEIMQILKEKHPEAQPTSPDVLLPITSPAPQAVVFENIMPKLVQKCSMALHGSGGSTLIDSDGCRCYH